VLDDGLINGKSESLLPLTTLQSNKRSKQAGSLDGSLINSQAETPF
jgi:hypothetical protein